MTEGKLSAEHELCNVQVDLLEMVAGVTIKLCNKGGVFLELVPKNPSNGETSGVSSEGEGEDL